MTNLITEARELCERATPGPWEVKQLDDCFIEPRICEIPANGCYDYKMVEANSVFIARSRTLVPELCDALEKAQEQNKQLLHELCKLACESIEREKNLARLEAEVMAACNSVRWVPVTERLPTGCGYYLSVVERIAPDELGGNNTRVKIMRWLGADWRYPTQIPKWINEAITETVTHWMALPAPPEEGAEHERD